MRDARTCGTVDGMTGRGDRAPVAPVGRAGSKRAGLGCRTWPSLIGWTMAWSPDVRLPSAPSSGRPHRRLPRVRQVAMILVFDLGGPLLVYSLLRSAGLSAVTALIL